jgi:tRNA(Ile)-lysidine synthetase-like protein
MNISIKPGKYVLAVSGGIDSMVLLDLLKNRPQLKLIIAHYDHGIRPDSEKDRLFVQAVADQYGLPFVYESGQLGPKTNEATARMVRYEFLERIRQANNAKAIITAHHQDDVLETAIINILRGTGRKGLTALTSRTLVIRPLLNVSKADIQTYAKNHQLQWREDSTNLDDKYLRNYVRKYWLTKFDPPARQRLIDIIERMQGINRELDIQLVNLMHLQPSLNELNRAWLISLPHQVAKEFLASWLRARGVESYDTKTLERLVVGAKTKHPGSLIDISGGLSLAVRKDRLALVGLER